MILDLTLFGRKEMDSIPTDGWGRSLLHTGTYTGTQLTSDQSEKSERAKPTETKGKATRQESAFASGFW